MTWRSCWAWRTTSKPATVARPASGLSSVARMRTVVVLPAPFGPSRPRTVPSSTVRSTPSRARTSLLRRLVDLDQAFGVDGGHGHDLRESGSSGYGAGTVEYIGVVLPAARRSAGGRRARRALRWRPAHRPSRSASPCPLPDRRAWLDRWGGILPLLLAEFVVWLGFGGLLPVLPLYFTEQGIDLATLGLVIAAWPAARLVSEPIFGWLADRTARVAADGHRAGRDRPGRGAAAGLDRADRVHHPARRLGPRRGRSTTRRRAAS